jgi:hypothetical protein
VPIYTKLQGVTNLYDETLTGQLQSNLIEFFNWGLLGIGAFSNVTIPTSGAYGGAAHILKPITDPNYTNGRVWEGFRQDWVWETGVEYVYQPINVSGVYVNNTFYPSNTTGVYAHHVNYPLGRVVFDTPLPTTSSVKTEYSYRYFHFNTVDVPWFQQLMFNSWRIDDVAIATENNSTWAILGQNRIQLPAVVVEVVPRRNQRGLQLGGGQWINQDVLFHIYSENPWDKNKLVDYISYQKERTLMTFDKNQLIAQNKLPLDADGTLVSGAMMYPQMVDFSGNGGFYWKKMFWKDVSFSPVVSNPPLYRAIVRANFEIDFPELA